MVEDYRYFGLAATYKKPVGELTSSRIIAVDLETYNTVDRLPVWIGIAGSPRDSWGFSLLPASIDIPWQMLKDPSIVKIAHNVPFDLRVLREWDVDTTNWIDTAVMARMALIPANLEDACITMETTVRPRHMGDVMREHGVKNTIDLAEDIIATKCGEDVLGTFQLYESLKDKVDMDYVRREMEMLPILETMSKRGIKIDQEIRLALWWLYSHELDALDAICKDQFGFSPHSPQQVAYTLSKRGNFLPGRRAKNTGKYSMRTDVKVLEKIMPLEPLAGLILEARHLKKMKGTYLEPFEHMERAYTYFHLDAATARISSGSTDKLTERNLQNIPGPAPNSTNKLSMRSMFLPDNGQFTDGDFSQIELRVLAYMANDRRMMEVLNDPNGDIHQETANFLHVPRKTAKNCTFAIIYGATAQTVMETAHLQDLRLAQRLLDQIFRLYPGVGDWIRSVQEFGWHHEYVQSLDGRKVSVVREDEKLNMSDRQLKASMARKSSNYPIQMSAGEIQKKALKISQVEVVERLGIPMSNQVHDQIIWDGYIPRLELPDFNGRVAPFQTPFTVKYTDRWE